MKESVCADYRNRERNTAYLDVGRFRCRNDDKVVIIVVSVDWRCAGRIVWESDDLVAAVVDDGLFAKVHGAGRRRIL
jgi:hypothetical protein